MRYNIKYLFLTLAAILGSQATTVQAAEFFRKQTGTVTLSGATSVTVTIEAVCMTQSFLVFSASTNDADPQDFQIGGQITNSTTLTFTRFNNSASVSTIKWQVFEFEGNVAVQRGTTNLNGANTINVGISSVDLTKSFVIVTMSQDGTTMGDNDGVTANLTTATNLQLQANANNAAFFVYWQVVEYQDAVVKKFTPTLNAGTASTTSDLSGNPISDLTKAMVLSNHRISANAGCDDLPRTEITDVNTVTYTRGGGTTATMAFVTYVIEFTDQTTVSRGSQAFSSGTTSVNFAASSSASSGIFGPGNNGRQGSSSNTTDNTGHVWFTYELASASTVTIERAVGTASTATAPYQIVTFEDQNTSPTTYYSFASGDWDSNTSWSLTSDGSSGAVGVGVYPRRTDNVVIRNGHSITVNAVDDNGLCGLSPNNLSRSNVGTFTGSGDLMFYHIGDILIANGGTLTVSEEFMIEGYTLVENGGTLVVTDDIINLGFLEISATATFTNTDDLILSGNSRTIINNTSTGADDIYMDWTNATLCGEGIMNLGNGGADPDVQFFNGATAAQICSSFSVTCTSNCGAFPFTPTGGFSTGNSGPGGVGSITSSGDVRLWLDANTISQSNGSNLSSWTDQSGYGNDATAPGGNEPVFNTNQLNGFPAIQFVNANSDYLQVADDASLDLSVTTMFTVGNLENSSTAYAGLVSKIQTGTASFNGYGLLRNNNTQGVTFTIDALGNEAQSAITYGTNAIHSSIYSNPGLEHFVNEGGPSTDSYAGPVTQHNTPLYIGATVNAAGTTPDRFLEGDIAEVVVLSTALNDAQRIIVDNYLSSKYNLTISNDEYSMDTPGNGNFDYEVAGIGQAADGSGHYDAKGVGVVRMWNPDNTGNSEFLIWGHDNTAITSTTTNAPTDVDGTVIEERLSRIWRVSETGDVGNVSISFDFSGVGGSPLGSNLRLMIDRDGDGFGDNDVTPIVGSVSNGVAVFSNINFQNGDRFTLGNTDASVPLPVSLTRFAAVPVGESVYVEWATSSELNNDYFSLERSGDAESWQSIVTLKGAGNSKTIRTYFFEDVLPISGQSYYRLRQVDFDGRFEFSNIVKVEFDQATIRGVYPNPSDGRFTLMGHPELKPEQIRIINNLGQFIRFDFVEEGGEVGIDIAGQPSGLYTVQISDGRSIRVIRILKY